MGTAFSNDALRSYLADKSYTIKDVNKDDLEFLKLYFVIRKILSILVLE